MKLSEEYGVLDNRESDSVFFFFKFKSSDNGDGGSFGWIFAWIFAWLGELKGETLRATGESVLDDATEKATVCFFVNVA